ncbi:MAG: hypothetical protein JF612_10350, partial [Planctomycetia bacterium]|nr:hypothetical protein [Planctomycetia bacterium]
MPSATSTALRCAASLSTQPRWQDALHETAAAALESLGGTADVALLFFSPHHAAAAEEIAKKACDLIGTSHLLGCTGEAIAGTAREVEEEPALSLWLARWPGARLTAMHLDFERTPEGGALKGWPDELADEWPAGSFLI